MDDDGWKSVKPFLQQHKINYPIVIGNSEMGDRFGFNSMPATLLIGKPFTVLYDRNTEHARSGKPTARERAESDLPEEATMESSTRQLPAAGWMSNSWVPAFTFVAGCYAVTWLAWADFHSAAATGKMWAFWTFLLVTVWSPTFIALAITAMFDRLSGVQTLLRRLFRLPSSAWGWYLAAIVLPSSSVFVATLLARSLHQGAPLIAMETLLPTMVIQFGTGALGEELGWRGFLLPILQRKASPVTSALIMSVLWSLWHSPSFFFPGLPQVFISPLPFLATVTAFGVFLSLIFNKTRGHVSGTILAHFVLNTSLALGGARFGNVLWWSLAGTFSLLACWSGFMLSRPSSPTQKN